MSQPVRSIETQLALAFAPLDKRALGIGVGVAMAVMVVVLTILSMIVDPDGRFPLGLLSQFFYGYDISVLGALIGAGWAFVVGFFWGWFAAFSRNLVYAIWLMTLRIRTDFSTSRDFLDHI